MSQRILASMLPVLFVGLLSVLLTPNLVRADAASDLADGQAAMQQANLDGALPLLVAAAEALPDSVEAQLALAECHLRLGQLDQALAQFQVVVRLSADHKRAGQMVATLSGRNASVDQQIAAAESLMAVGAWEQAARLLSETIRQPQEPTQRNKARLLLAESRLWFGTAPTALNEAVQVIQDSQDDALVGPARVIAALALIHMPERRVDFAERLLQQNEDLEAPWQSRAQVAESLIQLDRSSVEPATISSQLASSLNTIPDGGLRQTIRRHASQQLLKAAQSRLSQGDHNGTLAVIWPMLSNQPVPQADAAMQPVEISGGWLIGPGSSSVERQTLTQVLAGIGRAEFSASGSSASLLGYWLAAQVLWQSPVVDADAVTSLLNYSGQIGSLSQPAQGRQKGTILSRADDVQAAMLIALAQFAVSEDQRKQVVAQILVQVDRYTAVDDAATGLLQFGIAEGFDDFDIDFARAPVSLPPGEAHRTLLIGLGARHAALGAKAFQESHSSVLRDPDAALNVHDSVALTLFSLTVGQYPADATATKAADEIVARYTTADEWVQASQALTLFYAGQAGVDGRWAQVRLAIRQAGRTEDRLLAARRTIGAALSEQITEALAAAVAIVNGSATPANRQIAIRIAGSLASRYAGLERTDLSGSVIAAVGEGDDGAASLADWAIWMRAGLLEVQAARTLASAATRTDNRGSIAINEHHAAELKLLSGLITQFPQSEYATAAVNRVLVISVDYQSYRAFDSSSAVLTGFLEAQPNLTTAAQIEYQVVGISVSKALASFQERPDKGTPPTELTADHAAAIQALAAYLQKYPTGDQAPAAEDQLFSIARTYGEAGGWPVVRDVLAQFAAAVPDFRSPAHLQLLNAATWLGELDPQQGLALLTPTPPESAERSLRGDTELGQIISGGLIAKYDTVDPGNGPGGGFGGGGGFGPAPKGKKLPAGKPGDSPPPGTPQTATRQPPLLNAIPFTPRQAAELPISRPSTDSLAMIRESQARQFQQIAMLEAVQDEEDGAKEGKGGARTATGVVLPSGTVLSEAEITRQNDAADNAYAILIKLVLDLTPQNAAISVQARTQIMWMFGFFEGQVRPDRAIVLIRKYLADNPEDQERVALAYRALTDRFVQVSKRQPAELIDQEWVNARHQQFEQARGEIADFIEAWAGKAQWVNAARLLIVESYERESQLVAPFNRERAGGLLVQSAEAVLNLWQTAPGHPDAPGFPNRLWGISEQLANGGLNEAAIEVLRWIPNHFPTSDLAAQSTLRIAQLYASSLSNPVRAVETYHEYLSLNEGDPSVPTEIFSLAQQLGSQQRYLEALHVYGVFVDSFPTDARAAPALHAIGNTHQANGVWEDAITAYERVVEDYAGTEIIPQTRLDVAECRINLGEWAVARGLYEDFLDEYPKHAQAPMARTRIDVLKQLGRFQDLLTDDDVDRNKDDAQFQIGRTVLTQLQNPIKAVDEFRKVVADFANSDVADDAQLEIGRSLLSLGRMDDGRAELLKVPQLYPGSALADDALFLLAASYEQQAQTLAAVTQEKAREDSNLVEQQLAYQRFSRRGKLDKLVSAQTRDMIKEEGDAEKLALNDAFAAFRSNTSSVGQLFCEVTQAEQMTESETALQIANRRDRINDAYREAVVMYSRAATDYPLGDRTDQSLLKIAEILETRLKDGAAAMQTYQRIVKLFPGTPVAEDAAWKVARFQVEEGRYAAAADAFQTFIRNYPGSTRVADAQFGRAEVLEQLGRWNEAMDAYEVFRQKFNKHPKVTLAAQQITWIKTYRK